jgi:hypothetical protein
MQSMGPNANFKQFYGFTSFQMMGVYYFAKQILTFDGIMVLVQYFDA